MRAQAYSERPRSPSLRLAAEVRIAAFATSLAWMFAPAFEHSPKRWGHDLFSNFVDWLIITPLGVASFRGYTPLDWGAMSAASIVAIVSMLLFAVVVQKHIARG